jgi:hypothetical protein
MRYIVQDYMLPKNHLTNPNKTVYYIIDLWKRHLSFAYYLTYETAKEVVDRKNDESE